MPCGPVPSREEPRHEHVQSAGLPEKCGRRDGHGGRACRSWSWPRQSSRALSRRRRADAFPASLSSPSSETRDLGEVTLLCGTTEKTYRDPALVRRLLKAAGQNHRQAGRSRGGLDVIAPRSTRDQQGPGRRQHRRLRVRQPGQAGHGHDHHQLRAARGPARRARTSSSSATTSSTRSTSTTTATGKPEIDVPVQVQRRSCATRTRSSTTPARSRPLDSPTWNRRQFYYGHARSSTKRGKLQRSLGAAAVAVARRATSALARRRTTRRSRKRRSTRCDSGETVFAGQRNEGFFVDLGSIFDLGDLRPFQNLHLIPTAAAPGVDATQGAQRAHDRDPDPDHEADPRTARCRRTPTSPEGGARASGEPRAAARPG